MEVALRPPFFMSHPLRKRLIEIVEPAVVASGFELVDLRFLLEQGGWVLRVQIDRPLGGEARVAVGDCENMSRELSAVLDVDDPIPQAYHLEVSSPGIERPLRTPAHFAYFAGSEAKIALAVARDGRRNFRGVLRGVAGDKVAIECDGQTFELPIADIDHAKLVPDWDVVMQRKNRHGS